jgi:hypothetical protein
MSLVMKLTFIAAFLPLVVVSVYGLAIESQPVFVVFSLWAVGVMFLMLVGYLIFGGKRASKRGAVQEATDVRYGAPMASYPRGLHD